VNSSIDLESGVVDGASGISFWASEDRGEKGSGGEARHGFGGLCEIADARSYAAPQTRCFVRDRFDALLLVLMRGDGPALNGQIDRCG
jgi:hypothetical protein